MRYPLPTVRFRRGNTSPEHPGLVFFRYSSGKEVWVTPERFSKVKKLASANDKRWKATPAGRQYMRDYLREYQRQPKQVKRRAEYFQRTKEQFRHARNENTKKWHKCEKAKLARKRSTANCRDKIRVYRNSYNKRVRSTPEGKLRHNASSRIHSVFRNLDKKHKRGRTNVMLGCDFAFFRGWIEAQFKPGMTWQNHGSKPGQWEVDHKAPIRSFDITDPMQAAKAFHYTNCAPMWSHENRAKSDFIETNGQRIRARKNIIQFNKEAA